MSLCRAPQAGYLWWPPHLAVQAPLADRYGTGSEAAAALALAHHRCLRVAHYLQPGSTQLNLIASSGVATEWPGA